MTFIIGILALIGLATTAFIIAVFATGAIYDHYENRDMKKQKKDTP